MSDPVILIGTSMKDGSLKAVGLYPDIEAASYAITRRGLPDGCHYTVMTPPLGSTIEASPITYGDVQKIAP